MNPSANYPAHLPPVRPPPAGVDLHFHRQPNEDSKPTPAEYVKAELKEDSFKERIFDLDEGDKMQLDGEGDEQEQEQDDVS